jgi:galactan endo-1,6-beta-galactosidase
MHRLLSLIAALVLLPTGGCASYTTVINPQVTYGAWEGWGTSLCWWANVFGSRDDLADLVFTTNYVTLNGQSLPGLGMNIARYNAGGCNTNLAGGSPIQLSANMPAFKQIFGYWLNGSSTNPASASWDWTGDTNQRAMLQKAKARGANLLELFSNSPMWWMCNNHNPSGSANGTNDNLTSSNYQAHAIYLATIAKYAVTNWGVNFDSVEPFNEPSGDWWTATGTQEGCHFATNTQQTVIGYLRTELDSQGLTYTRVAASDESYYDQATSTWNSFSATTKAQIGEVNVHGYQYGGGRRDLLYAAVAGHRLWNSEYGDGDGDATGITLATNLNLDIYWLHPTAWCYWQALDLSGWGLIQSDPSINQIGAANPKYFVLAHYTRHIRPGMTLVNSGDVNTVAAYDAAGRKLVLVSMNYRTAKNITYNLSGFYQAAGPIRRWITTTGTGIEYVQTNSLYVTNQQFTAAFATNTIQTFEVQNVDLYSPPLLAASLTASNGQMTLTWPLTAAGYNLYATTNLSAGSGWQLVTNVFATNNVSYFISLPPIQSGQKYFRLSNP